MPFCPMRRLRRRRAATKPCSPAPSSASFRDAINLGRSSTTRGSRSRRNRSASTACSNRSSSGAHLPRARRRPAWIATRSSPERAEALERLIREHGYTQEALAERIGKDRTTIANSLRLLKLPPRVRQMVIEGTLSEGHGRALLGAPDAKTIEALAEKASRSGLSVRETERLVRSKKKDKEASQ